MDSDGLVLDFTGELWHWRGPAPYFFVTVPEEESRDLHAVASAVTYGWGMIPVRAQIGATEWETALFPQDELYVMPVKVAVRRAEDLEEGDFVAVRMVVVGPT